MFKQLLPLVALAAVAVDASPVQKRQQTSQLVSSLVESIIPSVVSSVLGADPTAAPSAGAGPAGPAGPAPSVSSVISSAVSSAESSAPSSTGDETYPAYPCPPGYLLTYIEQNITIPVSIEVVNNAIGPNWASSPIFPNVTDVNQVTEDGGRGSTRTINVGGLALNEVFTNFTQGPASAIYNWNLTNGPVEAMGVGISNYSTVLSVYDPDYDTTGVVGNTTTALTYTNFCATSQSEGMTLVNSLAALELANIRQLSTGMEGPAAGPAGPEGSASMMPSMTDSMMMPGMTASSVAGAASSVASSAVGAASSAASSISSQVSSAVASVVSPPA